MPANNKLLIKRFAEGLAFRKARISARCGLRPPLVSTSPWLRRATCQHFSCLSACCGITHSSSAVRGRAGAPPQRGRHAPLPTLPVAGLAGLAVFGDYEHGELRYRGVGDGLVGLDAAVTQ